jgi:hypothetical protein
MTTKPQIPRDHVHALSEECAKLGMGFQTAARRMLDDQSRLLRFFKANLPDMQGQTGEVSLYLLAVVVRIFQQTGKLGRVSNADVEAATKRIQGVAGGLLPVDDGFPERVRAIGWRAQPHILDEAMHALFEREEKQANEVELEKDQAARVFLMLWAATEALEGVWTPQAEPAWASAT